jgi:hypothetical protein
MHLLPGRELTRNDCGSGAQDKNGAATVNLRRTVFGGRLTAQGSLTARLSVRALDFYDFVVQAKNQERRSPVADEVRHLLASHRLQGER